MIMKSINYRICYLCFSIFILSACSSGGDLDDLLNKQTANTTNSDDNNNNNQNTAANNEISASEASLSFTADGGSKSISVTSNFSWETISKPSWITISPSSGSKGTTNLTVTASKSASTTSRAGTISFGKSSSATTSISVSQAAASSGGSGSGRTYTVNGVSFKMISVEGGMFTMGGTTEQGEDSYYDEKPVHSVMLDDFSIGETEVTNELWVAVMGSLPYGTMDARNKKRPVNCVNWDASQEFIRKLNSITGENFRLPTEAEWEYAARGGKKSKGYRYAGSNTISDVAWYVDNSGGDSHDVATKKANELGLYDMSGNVDEWCYDWYGTYSSETQKNPSGPYTGTKRVFRSGYYHDSARTCRVSRRLCYDPSYTSDTRFGLRLAL